MKRFICFISCLLLTMSIAAQDTGKKPEKNISSPSVKDTLNKGIPQKAMMEKKTNADTSMRVTKAPPQKAMFEAKPGKK